MPNRIIREAILSSEKVAQLGWPEEVFYRRLMSIVDDYGRTEANPQLLRSKCYPLQTDAVRVTDISRWMAACQTAGLILYYAVQGKQYLEVCNFGQQQRSASKFPSPSSIDDQALAVASKCSQAIADAHLGVFVSVVEDVSVIEDEEEKGARKRARPSPIPRPDDVDEQTWGDWLQLRKTKRAPVTGTVVAEAQREAIKANLTLQRFLEIWCARGSQGLQADWLKPSERSPGPTQAMSFAERDAENRAARIHDMTGGLMGKPKASNLDFIDMEDTHGKLLG